LEVAVFDFNGTIALDGNLIAPIKSQLEKLALTMEIHVLTSDTFGTVRKQCETLPVQVHVLQSSSHIKEKADYLDRFGNRQVVAIGNGANDQLMLEKATLGIAVIGSEGCSSKTILAADLVVNNIVDGINLLLNPKRLIAGLRR
jgi:soluble P-type ATPase